MAPVRIKFVRVTAASVPIANAEQYERLVDSSVVPQVGDWVRFTSGTHKVETRSWEYSDDAPTCSLGIDFVGQLL
jgi:hypothetical protein